MASSGVESFSALDQAPGSRAGAAKPAATMEEDERPQSPEDDEEATRKPTAVERRLEQRVKQLAEARSASILAQAAAEAICRAKDAELLRMHARIGEAEQRGQNAAKEVEEVVMRRVAAAALRADDLERRLKNARFVSEASELSLIHI